MLEIERASAVRAHRDGLCGLTCTTHACGNRTRIDPFHARAPFTEQFLFFGHECDSRE